MKWKTNTIIFILLISIVAITLIYLDKRAKIEEVNNRLEASVKNGVESQIEEITSRYQEKVKVLEQENTDLKNELTNLKEKIDFIRHGGEVPKYRSVIKSNAVEHKENLKIRKGEVYRHEKSDVVVYVKRDYYEDRVLINITLPNRATEEDEWEIGKYFYFWNPQRTEMSQILPTFISEEHVELEWLYYEQKAD